MKKRFNFIAILILAALTTSIIIDFSIKIDDLTAGFNDGMGQVMDDNPHGSTMHHWIDIIPIKNREFNFTITNKKNQEQVTFIPRTIVAKTAKSTNTTIVILHGITGILALAIYIISIRTIVFFIKFTLAVNKGFVFAKQNLSHLNNLGWSLILNFVCVTLFSLANFHIKTELFDIQGYKLILGEPIPFIWLLGGLTILLIRQFVAMGIKMKEEQDLTI